MTDSQRLLHPEWRFALLLRLDRLKARAGFLPSAPTATPTRAYPRVGVVARPNIVAAKNDFHG